MNKIVLFFTTLFFSCFAQGVTIHGLYTASCERELGVILDVTNRHISLLTISGRIQSLDRFQVISVVKYSIDAVPIQEVSNPELIPLFEVRTLTPSGLRPLVTGWPVGFSKDRVAFLSISGVETLVSRDAIWRVRSERRTDKIYFGQKSQYRFIHPHSFSHCPVSADKHSIEVNPQEIFFDPVSIKTEFDRMSEGFSVFRRYELDQLFYSRPQIYENRTVLGFWLSSGSRYGSSSGRAGSFSPLLQNQFSAGPFGFQSEFNSGAGPLIMLSHEEVQTHVFYRLKADYFHFSAMIDPNLLLVGKKYVWAPIDLNSSGDIRSNESAIIEAGFDYGPFALEFHLGGVLSAGARQDNLFSESSLEIGGLGVRYYGYRWFFHAFYRAIQNNASARENWSGGVSRVNLELDISRDSKLAFSLIHRELNYESGSGATSAWRLGSNSQTVSIRYDWQFLKRYWAGGYVSGESNSNETSVSKQNQFHPKAGAQISISF